MPVSTRAGGLLAPVADPPPAAAGKRRSGSGGAAAGGEAGGGAKKGRPAFTELTNTGAAVGAEAKHSPPSSTTAAAAAVPAAPAARPTAFPCDPIDEADRGDSLACVDYVADIMDALFEAERRCRPTPSYIEAVQTEVNATMRGILVDWLVEVAAEFRLVSDTLYAAVAYVDRVLSVRRVERPRLQLVGVAATLVAAKYEEIYAPSADEFVYITDGTYTRAEVLAAETDVLAALDFELSAPTAKTFLRRFVKAAAADGGFPRADAGGGGGGGGASTSAPAYDRRLAPLAAYVCELGLLEYAALQWLPSTVAAAAVAVARWALGAAPWGPALGRAARAGPADVAPAASLLAAALAGAASAGGGGGAPAAHRPAASTSPAASPSGGGGGSAPQPHPPQQQALPAVRDKYGQPQYLCVAALPAPPPLPADPAAWWGGGGGGDGGAGAA